MARSKAAPAKDMNTILVDETHPTSDGGKARILVDIVTITDFRDQYAAALRDARGIPFDLENLGGRDTIIRHLINAHGGKISDALVLSKARSYYDAAVSEVNANAILLAFFSHEDNTFSNEPTPYPVESRKTLPGIVAMPEIRKDLSDPAEFRLKQILDVLVNNPVIFSRVTELSQSIAVKLNRLAEGYEVDPLGFQPGSTGEPVHENDVSGGVVESAEA